MPVVFLSGKMRPSSVLLVSPTASIACRVRQLNDMNTCLPAVDIRPSDNHTCTRNADASKSKRQNGAPLVSHCSTAVRNDWIVRFLYRICIHNIMNRVYMGHSSAINMSENAVSMEYPVQIVYAFPTYTFSTYTTYSVHIVFIKWFTYFQYLRVNLILPMYNSWIAYWI